MASSPVNLEWENQNALRDYPFREGSLRQVETPGLTLPLDALLDLFAFVQARDDARFYLAEIEVSPDLALTLRFKGATTHTLVGSVQVPSGFIPGASFELAGEGWGTTGKLVVGPGLRVAQRWGIGTFSLLAAEAELEGTTMVPLDFGVVTSIGIEGRPEVLTGDVTLEPGRAISIETNAEDNSLILSAIKFIEDCEEKREGCAIQTINGLRPDASGNIVLSTEGIIAWSKRTNGIALRGIWEPGMCAPVFNLGLRGAAGPPGPPGPSGPPGFNLLCTGGICCGCEQCDSCEQWDNILSPPRIGGNSAENVPSSEGGNIEITGVDFKYQQGKPDNTTLVVPLALCATWCKPDGTQLNTSLAPGSTNTSVVTSVPAGLTTPPSGDDTYSVRLKTPWGWTNSTLAEVLPAGGPPPVKVESFDVIGGWTPLAPAAVILESVNHFEGAGALNILNLPPLGASGIVANTTGLSAFGAPPWDFSTYTSMRLYLVKEFDPLEAFAADSISLVLTDALFATFTVPLAVPAAARYATPHALSPGDFYPLLFPLAAPTIDITQVIAIGFDVTDLNASVSLSAWYDCMELIP